MSYPMEIISIGKGNKYWRELKKVRRIRHERKADINGCCIKLMTDDIGTANTFDENFFHLSERIRSHGRVLVFDNPNIEDFLVEYEPLSRSAFLWNCDYYGYVKSIALAVAGDILEDVHRFYSVHGACLDYKGKGMALVGASGAGKTTLSLGILVEKKARIISDDWFYVRFQGGEAVAMSSEKNVYMREMDENWGTIKSFSTWARFDKKKRAVVNLKNIFSGAKIRDRTTLTNFMFLKRDTKDKNLIRTVEANKMLSYMVENNFFNPHLLVRDERKQRLRIRFLKNLFKKVNLYVINAITTPKKTVDLLLKTING
jgi:hypothetical protein